jgi:hypothetical protein
MNEEDYRVQDKSAVNLNGRAATSFKLFERQGRAFAFVGSFFRPGVTHASDAQCIGHALYQRDHEEFDPLDLDA